MGYYVRALPYKKCEPKLKVQYVSFKKSDYENSTAKFPKKEWDICTDHWCALGFYRYMTLEEAKVRARQLNSHLEIKRQDEQLLKIEEKNLIFRTRFDSMLPIEFVSEFEKRFMRKRDSEVDRGKRRRSRAMHVWKAAQKMIVAVGIEPTDWFYSTYEIYDYFYTKKYSLKYIQSILKIANLWGYFFCKKTGRAFLKKNRFDGKKVVLFNSHNSKFEQRFIDEFKAIAISNGASSFEHKVILRGRVGSQVSPEEFLQAVDKLFPKI